MNIKFLKLTEKDNMIEYKFFVQIICKVFVGNEGVFEYDLTSIEGVIKFDRNLEKLELEVPATDFVFFLNKNLDELKYIFLNQLILFKSDNFFPIQSCFEFKSKIV